MRRGTRRLGGIGGVDFGIYLRGVAILFAHPVLVVPIVLADLVGAAITGGASLGGGGGFAGSFITSLIAQIVNGFGLGLAIIGADLAWRGRPASPSAVLETGRRRFADLAWAAIGFNFVLWAARLVITYLIPLGGPYGVYLGDALAAVALFFVIYTMPAAATSGMPGTAAVNASVEQARDRPAPTVLLTAVYLLANTIVPEFVFPAVLFWLAGSFPQVIENELALIALTSVVLATLQAYVAVMLAKVYDDLSLRRFLR